MLIEQFDAFWATDTGIERDQLAEVERTGSIPHAVIISGLRRAGKSTLLSQTAHRLGKEACYFLNFEDDRFLGFQVRDAGYLHQILLEVFGDRKIFLVDEIQSVDGWEHFVRRFMDLGYKFYITGSNASLLSRELGTRLTGRYIPIELYPFSFAEYLKYMGHPPLDPQRPTIAAKAALNAMLQAYMKSGGIPDALKYPDLPLLKTLYNDILYRDIATRHQLEAVSALKELAFFLMSHPGGLVSFNKMKGQFRLGSVNTIKNYIGFMENSWLIFCVNVYDSSLKRQQIAPKKVYAVDTGLCRAVGYFFSPNSGKLLENLVFLALRRNTKNIHYLSTPGGFEVDFFLPETGRLIQVTRDMNNPAVREREIRALDDALNSLKAQSALILCDENADRFDIKGVPVDVRSTSEWLLEP